MGCHDSIHSKRNCWADSQSGRWPNKLRGLVVNRWTDGLMDGWMDDKCWINQTSMFSPFDRINFPESKTLLNAVSKMNMSVFVLNAAAAPSTNAVSSLYRCEVYRVQLGG